MIKLENEIQLKNIINEQIINEKTVKHGISVRALRIDLIHPIISGNKYFKLKYYLQDAITRRSEGLLSFGGAWSNHIVAVAYAAAVLRIKSIGVIRGEESTNLSQTLLDAKAYGMDLKFISREEYSKKNDENWIENLKQRYPHHYFVSEGGYGPLGASGAADILELLNSKEYSHICCACGTGTMLAGIINSMNQQQQAVGISVLKGSTNQLELDIKRLLQPSSSSKKFDIHDRFHFGGYAKYNQSLFDYMNNFYRRHQIPTDFVYTGKLFYATEQLIDDGFFEVNSNILIIHSGGLQGNLSLKRGTLIF
jgi:1-aminocyclopropane-1-carboxylate deaminase